MPWMRASWLPFFRATASSSAAALRSTSSNCAFWRMRMSAWPSRPTRSATDRVLKSAAISDFTSARCRVRRGGGNVELPDAAALLRLPALDPVGEIQRAVGPEPHAGGEQATAHDRRVLGELEPGALRRELEPLDGRDRRRAGEHGVEEVALPRVAQRGARVVREAGRTGVPRRDGWREVRRLARPARLEHALVHPDLVVVVVRIDVLAELPVDAPAAVHAVDDVDERAPVSPG